MALYNEALGQYRETALKYQKRGEKFKVSRPIIFYNKKYYEIIYNKSFLGIANKNTSGRVIIDEQGKPISEKNTLKSLIRLFYYYSFLLGIQHQKLKSIIKTDEQVKKDRKIYSEASALLAGLSNDGVAGASAIKNVIDGFPDMREKSNEVLKLAVNKIEQYLAEDAVITDTGIYEILSLYEKSQLMNFERVKFANGAADYYDAVKREVVRRRKKLKYKIDKKNIGPLMRLEDIISFFINILRYYGDTINFSIDKYKKLLGSRDNENIDQNYTTIRI